MNFPGVINGDEDMLLKLEAFKDTPIDGHGPTLTGLDLNAYRINGILTDHECASADEMIEKIGMGMYIAIREGSAVKDLDTLFPAINDYTKNQTMFCTDDKHAHELLTIGHIDHIIRKAIKKGLDPITAIQMATINPSRCYNLKNQGAIAPGYTADIILVDNLKEFNVTDVYKDGVLVAQNNQALFDVKSSDASNISDTINIQSVSKDLFKLKLTSNKVHVIGVQNKSLVTKLLIEEIPLNNQYYEHEDKNIQKIAVIERHGHTDNIGLGLIKGLNIYNGAIATSISHDSHNIIVAGDNDEYMMRAVNKLIEIKGGIVVVSKDSEEVFPLPIGGLMTDEPLNTIAIKTDEIKSFARKHLSIPYDYEPFMTLSFMALPVIPEVKITDQGLFNVSTQSFIPIEAN